MAIKRVEINGFLVFKGEFTADFCPGVNVFIGGNGTGKTTLLKLLFWLGKYSQYDDWESNPESRSKFVGIEHYFGVSPNQIRVYDKLRIESEVDDE